MPKRRDGAAERVRRFEVERMLPLRPAAFAVLAALAERPAAGFEVLERVNEVSAGLSILGPGTFYRLLRELRKDGLISRTESPAKRGVVADERRTYHALTALGRAVLRAEAERLRRTMRAAGLLATGDAG